MTDTDEDGSEKRRLHDEMDKYSKMALLAGAAGVVLAAAGCGGDQAASSAAESGKKVVKVAHTAYYFPYDFVDDNNKSDALKWRS